jgi:hypothetical protein
MKRSSRTIQKSHSLLLEVEQEENQREGVKQNILLTATKDISKILSEKCGFAEERKAKRSVWQ